MANTKFCNGCKQEKPTSDFMKRSDSDRLRSRCVRCNMDYNIVYRGSRKDKVKKWAFDSNQKLRIEVIGKYSNGSFMCACCGESNMKFLTIDHINGGGNKERKELKKLGTAFYTSLRLRKYPEGYQVLCFNCNMAKGIYKVCPHKQNV